MKKTIKILFTILFLSMVYMKGFSNPKIEDVNIVVASNQTIPSNNQDTAKVVYTCSMHPEVISDKPGKCPKCGMDLVLKNGDTSKHKGMGCMGMMHNGKSTGMYIMGGVMVVMMISFMIFRFM